MPSWWPHHQSSHAYPASNPTHNSPKTNHCIPHQNNPSQLCEEGKDNRVTIPTKRRNIAQATRQLRVVLGPSVAKKTQQQPKTRVLQQPNFIVKTMATSHSPETEEKPNSQRRHGKTQPTDLEIHSPQHTQFLNVVTEENYTDRNGKETNFQSTHA